MVADLLALAHADQPDATELDDKDNEPPRLTAPRGSQPSSSQRRKRVVGRSSGAQVTGARKRTKRTYKCGK